ncbi:MAG: zinc ribbon domain-containing protein [Thermoanaerobacteraceae bacterium]|uniref:FmdB family zinc ribbon protein n=1 Tax=Thermanaeromonas sp. C210 TaxID=2731925 RepID=UPI00155C68D6|nr:FmdB family zinc ribbon protein [Thermanaeromonas sp. C210]MBE3581789.1 zinc ribbon domain-containing protein [Thermoanaerobacteraceae bacterium]GFN22768.1 FmdB family transcriptional regulator [Thermanaeromonas sp. C210]
MPIYVYKCPQCGTFETEQRITAPALESCPTCGSPVHRVITGNISVIYKGSGFHTTDYRSKDYKEKAKSESENKGDVKAAS